MTMNISRPAFATSRYLGVICGFALAAFVLLATSLPASAQPLQVNPQFQVPQLQLQAVPRRVVSIQGGGLQFLDGFAPDQYNLGRNVVIASAQNNPNQRWELTDTGNGFLIMQQSTGQFLDAHEIAELDFRVVTRNRQTFDNTQLWRLTGYGGGFYTIQQVTSGRFLEPYLDAEHGFAVVTRPERPGDNLQLWRLGDL
jgi:hypothetical protein